MISQSLLPPKHYAQNTVFWPPVWAPPLPNSCFNLGQLPFERLARRGQSSVVLHRRGGWSQRGGAHTILCRAGATGIVVLFIMRERHAVGAKSWEVNAGAASG